jgi:hypothetical protein
MILPYSELQVMLSMLFNRFVQIVLILALWKVNFKKLIKNNVSSICVLPLNRLGFAYLVS